MDAFSRQMPLAADRCAETLKELCGKLEGISRSTEDEFLAIGGNLSGLYLRVGELAEFSGGISRLITGAQINCAIDGLGGGLERMSLLFEGEVAAASDRTAALTKIKRNLQSIDKPLSGFVTVYNTLKSLSLSVKIESGRLCDNGAGFSLLANDVSDLSVQVKNKVCEIIENKADLTATIGRTLDLLGATSAGQIENVGTVVEGARRSLCDFGGINRRCAEVVSSVESTATGVSRDIGEVVTSIQFHDIVRQQVEHVLESLRELQQRRTTRNENPDPETHHVCALQAAQLRHARDEFVEAVTRIIESLREVGERQTLIADTSRSVADNGQGTGSCFRALEDGLLSLTSALAGTVRKNRELSLVVTSLAGTVADISGFVNEIKNIGEDIKLIAINARIKASRTGSDGTAIGVLADSVKELSLEAMRRSRSVSGFLQCVVEEAGELCSGTAASIAGLEADIQEIPTAIDDMLKTIGGVKDEVSRSLERMDAKVASLAQEISTATQGITAHTRFASVAGEVVGRLDALAAEALKLSPQECTLPVAGSAWWLSDRYTMQSQRNVHAAVTGATYSAPARISARPAAAAARQAAPEETGDGLLDNFEMF